MKKRPLEGQKFGHLLVLRENPIRDKWNHVQYFCLCDCGKEWMGVAAKLTGGNTKSCGCYQKTSTNNPNYRHGLYYQRIHGIWTSMLARCNNPNRAAYKYYGRRGIQVCERWKDFKNFYDDMWPSFIEGLTLDRINNDGNYEPSNCRWATMKEQVRNQRKRFTA